MNDNVRKERESFFQNVLGPGDSLENQVPAAELSKHHSCLGFTHNEQRQKDTTTQ